MLTSDLVRATRRGGLLHITPLAGKQRQRAEELAETYLGLALAQCGSAHHELRAAWAAVEVAAREVKLASGLTKLIEDACEFEAESEIEPRQLRSEVFSQAAGARRSLGDEQRFERHEVLERVGQAHGGASPVVIERALYSDLKAEHRLLRAPDMSVEQLLVRYDLAQLQAVLLKAVRVSAQISCGTPEGYREIFRKLKFRRLMFEIQREESGGYRVDIDGPFSLFESVTKYGLQLAMMLPALLRADRLSLRAELRWGKARSPLQFTLERQGGPSDGERARLPDEVEALLEAFGEAREGWRAAPADHVLDLPGIGLCVPDVRFEHESGAIVFLEVLGYWSRDAVWRRIELVQKGVGHKLLFAASQRLRVSEAVLADHPSGALYVYKGSLSAKAIVERLERLRQA